MKERPGGFNSKHSQERSQTPHAERITRQQWQSKLAYIYTQLGITQEEQRTFAKQPANDTHEMLRQRVRQLQKKYHPDIIKDQGVRSKDINSALTEWEEMYLRRKFQIIDQPQAIRVQPGQRAPQSGLDDFDLATMSLSDFLRALGIGRKKK